MCQVAWSIMLPSVKEAAELGVTNKFAGVIVVLDPTKYEYPSDELTEEDVLFTGTAWTSEEHRGNADKYRQIALAKAKVAWRTGLPSREVQQNAPFLYMDGDTKWGGSVERNGLVVAFSGVQAVFDEWIAASMAELLIAMCRHEMTKPDGVMDADDSFIAGGLNPDYVDLPSFGPGGR